MHLHPNSFFFLTYPPHTLSISVEDALAHPYLEQLHFPDDEPCGPKISKHEFDFER